MILRPSVYQPDPDKIVPILERAARAVTTDPSLQDDLVQDAWFEASRICESYDPEKGPFEPWAYRLAIRRMRRRRHDIQRPIRIPADLFGAQAQRASQSRKDAANAILQRGFLRDSSLEEGTIADLIPEREKEENQVLDAVMETLEDLEEREREALILHFGLNGRPQTAQAIAKDLKISVTEANEALRLGLENLKARLDPDHEKGLSVMSNAMTLNHEPIIKPGLLSRLPPEPPVKKTERCPDCHRVYKNQSTKACYYTDCVGKVPAMQPKPASQPEAACCPKCSRPFSNQKMRRCYHRDCEGSGLKGKFPGSNNPANTKPATRKPAPTPASPAHDPMAELQVMQQLAALSPEAARRVLQWGLAAFGSN